MKTTYGADIQDNETLGITVELKITCEATDLIKQILSSIMKTQN